ncbi:MAG: reverse transcriptase family protein [Cytophagales bacterium]|nr:reverse transcriptase family protein [Cytophagales bacterium]
MSEKLSTNFEDVDDPNLITKKFWSYVKATSSNTRIPELVHRGNVYKNTPADQSNLFNTFFYQQFSEPSNYDITIEYSPAYGNFEINFSTNRIEGILSKLNVNKAIGPDKIHGKILKNCAAPISIALSILFSKSYNSGYIPSEWKYALIVPVHKKGSKSDVENYRPISLTSLVVKVMERIVRDELMFKCNHLLDPRQHGFLPGKSCSTQLVEYCDSLSLSLNKNIRADAVYFDFAKAFDSVNHDLILSKLKTMYGINGKLLRFIKSYLSDRTQSVVVNGSVSSSLPVISGVPQGSIIGPSLFVLFLNDITSGLSECTEIMMYADDTKIWREMHCEADFKALQSDIDYLLDWAIRNKMKFHPSKCKVLSICSSKPPLIDILPCVQFFYSMGDFLIDYVDSEKDLGILMNSTLNFTEQADYLYNKANQKFGMLKRTCHFVSDPKKRRALYLTLVRSLFEHCPSVWRPASNTMVEKLESLQKRAIKWINDDYRVSYSNDSMYYVHCKHLNILPIRFRFDYHDIKLLHSIIYNFSCIRLPDYLKFFSGSTRLRSTHQDSLSLVSSITPRGSYESSSSRGFSNNYFYRSHLIWNKLPFSLRETIRPGKFKNDLINYIWKELVPIGNASLCGSDSDGSE